MQVCVRVCPASLSASGVGAGPAGARGAALGERGVVTVGEGARVVYCPEPDLSHVTAYDVDAAFDERAATTHVFQGAVLPLVARVLQGEHATAIVCGEDAVAKALTAEGRPLEHLVGLAGLSVEALVNLMEHEGLGVSSSPQGGRGGASGVETHRAICVSWCELGEGDDLTDLLREASGMPPGPGAESGLKLRDDPKVGVTAPGLWEVEVKRPDDVGELLRRVRSSVRDFNERSAYVFSITLRQTTVRRYGRGGPGKGGGGGRMKPVDSDVKVSRLNIITMANASGGAVPGWVRALNDVLEGLETKSPSIPFRKSKLTMWLREPLSGSHAAALIACVSSSIHDAAPSSATLKFCGRVRAMTGGEGGDDDYGASAPMGDSLIFDSGVLHGGGGPSTSSWAGGASADESMPGPAPPAAASPTRAADAHTADAGDDSRGGFGASQSGTPAAAAPGRAAPTRQPAPDSDQGTTNGISIGGNGARGVSSDDPLARAEAMAAKMAALSSAGDESARWFTALLSALEVSREETRELRLQAEAAAREAGTAQVENEHLRARAMQLEQQLAAARQEEPVSLEESADPRATIRQLKVQLKAALREIKDYELYKDVMETAVVRMQEEAKQVAGERDQARRDLAKAHAATRRATEEIVRARRRANEAESQLLAMRGKRAEPDSPAGRAHATAVAGEERSARLKSRLDDAMRELDAVKGHNARLTREIERLRAKSGSPGAGSSGAGRRAVGSTARPPPPPQPRGALPAYRADLDETSRELERERAAHASLAAGGTVEGSAGASNAAELHAMADDDLVGAAHAMAADVDGAVARADRSRGRGARLAADRGPKLHTADRAQRRSRSSVGKGGTAAPRGRSGGRVRGGTRGRGRGRGGRQRESGGSIGVHVDRERGTDVGELESPTSDHGAVAHVEEHHHTLVANLREEFGD